MCASRGLPYERVHGDRKGRDTVTCEAHAATNGIRKGDDNSSRPHPHTSLCACDIRFLMSSDIALLWCLRAATRDSS